MLNYALLGERVSRNQTKWQLHRREEGEETALWNLSAEPERDLGKVRESHPSYPEIHCSKTAK